MIGQSLSVIVPTLNEEERLAATLTRIATGRPTEIIVVDGGSTDRTAEIAADFPVIFMHSAKGRGRQMNAGVAKATGDLLLFVHADTLMPDGYADLIRRSFDRPGVVGGAFSLRIELEGRLVRLIERLANRRAVHAQMPYGDQGLFLRKDDFSKVGGFPDLPLLEDVVLVDRLRSLGRLLILPQPAVSSGRRWQRHGVLTTSLINRLIILGYRLGVSPARLARLYYGAAGN